MNDEQILELAKKRGIEDDGRTLFGYGDVIEFAKDVIAASASAKPVAWARADVPDRLGSRTAYSVTTELLKNPKDGYIPLYAAPAIDAAPDNTHRSEE